jgi:hypothetical protein
MGKVRISGEDTNIDISGGGLKTDNGVGVASGDYAGESIIHKFGATEDFDTGDGFVTIWDGADDAGIDAMNYTYSTTCNIDSISSNSTSDTGTIEIQGLGTGFSEVTQTVTLSGTSKVALATTLMRVFRMKNTITTSNVGHVYCYVTTAITSGVPNVSSYVRAVIQPTLNQTLMAVYTIPAGKTGYMKNFFFGEGGAQRSTNYVIDLKARKENECFQLKHRAALSDTGTGYVQHNYEIPQKFVEKTDIEMTGKVTAAAITGAVVVAGFELLLKDN